MLDPLASPPRAAAHPRASRTHPRRLRTARPQTLLLESRNSSILEFAGAALNNLTVAGDVEVDAENCGAANENTSAAGATRATKAKKKKKKKKKKKQSIVLNVEGISDPDVCTAVERCLIMAAGVVSVTLETVRFLRRVRQACCCRACCYERAPAPLNPSSLALTISYVTPPPTHTRPQSRGNAIVVARADTTPEDLVTALADLGFEASVFDQKAPTPTGAKSAGLHYLDDEYNAEDHKGALVCVCVCGVQVVARCTSAHATLPLPLPLRVPCASNYDLVRLPLT